MYELKHIAGGTSIIESPAKIGLYTDAKNNAILIDSGLDKEAGRKINQHLKAMNLNLSHIISTHSNADHIGGNAFLQARTDAKVLTTDIEGAFTRNTILEPSFLYGGYPPKPLRNKLLMAQESVTSAPIAAGDRVEGLEGFEFISLKGHYFDMIGVRTPDDVLFLADALCSENIVTKYHVSFLYDVRSYIETLNMIENLEASVFIPSHAEPTEDIRPLVKLNRDKVLEVADTIEGIISEPKTPDEIIKAVFSLYGLTMDFNQYVLVGSTVKSYLSYLMDEGRATAEFVENRLVWSAG